MGEGISRFKYESSKRKTLHNLTKHTTLLTLTVRGCNDVHRRVRALVDVALEKVQHNAAQHALHRSAHIIGRGSDVRLRSDEELRCNKNGVAY